MKFLSCLNSVIFQILLLLTDRTPEQFLTKKSPGVNWISLRLNLLLKVTLPSAHLLCSPIFWKIHKQPSDYKIKSTAFRAVLFFMQCIGVISFASFPPLGFQSSSLHPGKAIQLHRLLCNLRSPEPYRKGWKTFSSLVLLLLLPQKSAPLPCPVCDLLSLLFCSR